MSNQAERLVWGLINLLWMATTVPTKSSDTRPVVGPSIDEISLRALETSYHGKEKSIRTGRLKWFL